MSRVLDAIKRDGFGGVGGSSVKNVMNLATGGMNGLLPKIGVVDTDGKLKDAWISNHPYIREDIIPVPLSTPKAFDYLPGKELWKSTWISLLTEHMHVISGFNSEVEVSTEEERINKSEEMQETPTGTRVARTVITGEVKEKANKTISKFLTLMINHIIGEMWSNKPIVSQYLNINDIGGGYTPEYWSSTILWIEPDILKQTVQDAWYTVQFYPKNTGQRTGSKKKESAGEGVTLSINFAGITFSTQKVFDLAEKILPTINGIKLLTDNDLLLANDGIDPDAKI